MGSRGYRLAASARSRHRAPPEEKWISAGMLAAFTAFHINGITQVNFYDGKSQHSLMLCMNATCSEESSSSGLINNSTSSEKVSNQ